MSVVASPPERVVTVSRMAWTSQRTQTGTSRHRMHGLVAFAGRIRRRRLRRRMTL